MADLNNVTVTGTVSDDMLVPIFSQAYAVTGVRPDPEEIKAQITKFKAENEGANGSELLRAARNEVPRMVSSILGSRAPTSSVDEGEKLADLRQRTAEDRQGRKFLSYGAAALSKNPTEAGKDFVDAAG